MLKIHRYFKINVMKDFKSFQYISSLKKNLTAHVLYSYIHIYTFSYIRRKTEGFQSVLKILSFRILPNFV